MLSIKTALFLSCIGIVVSYPGFFRPLKFNLEGEIEQPLMTGDQPMYQVQGGSPSYEYDGAGAAPGAGTSSEEVDTGGATGSLGQTGGETAEADSPDAGENEAAVIGGAGAGAQEAAAGFNSHGAVQVEDIEDNAAPNNFGGGPGLVKKGEKSTAGRNAGIAVGVLATVGLAAGVGYYVYRKKRAATYGARF